MKRTTIQSLVSYLNGATIDNLDAIKAELEAELNKNAEAYESIHELVVGTLSAVPVTIAELWDAIKDEVPAGITKGKVQYAVTHLWESEIVKIEGKPNTYRLA